MSPPELRSCHWCALLALSALCACSRDGQGTDSASPPDDEQVEDTIGATLVEHGVLPASDGTDRAALGPMQEWDAGGAWAIQRPAKLEKPKRGAGIVVADLNGDGRLDVFLPNLSACELYLGDDEFLLVDASEGLPNADADCDAWAASAADVDGDGDLDLFLASRGRSNHLYLNAGDATFTDATDGSGLGKAANASVGGSWSDVDGDGDLDLFVANHADRESEVPGEVTPNELYLNNGSGVFTDSSDLLGVAGREGATFVGGWWDVDGDGARDLYLVNDWGNRVVPNQLLLNQSDGLGRTFDSSHAGGLGITGCTMGLGAGDLNDDGVIDFAVTDIGSIHLLVSTAGDWFDMAASLGVGPDAKLGQISSWSIELADLDNDTDLDLIATFGTVEQAQDPDDLEGQPDGVWLRGDDGSFQQVGEQWDMAQETVGRGMALADFNGDGWLDVFRRDYKGGPTRLDVARPGTASWLEVDVVGPAPNRFGIGATVLVTAGGHEQRRWIQSGSTAMASSAPPMAHFGLGSAATVDQLVVIWPDGERTSFEDVDARQALTVIRDDAEAGR